VGRASEGTIDSMYPARQGGARFSRHGRVDLAWLVAALSLGALLAVVLLGRLTGGPHSGTLDGQATGLQPQSGVSSALAEAISKLDQRLARIEAALTVQETRGTREEVNAPSIPAGNRPQLGAGAEGSDQLHNDLLQLSNRVDALAESLKENRNLSFQFPTLQQMRSARRDVDGAFLEDVRTLWFKDPKIAFERVRLMSFDDLLTRVGAPAMIDKNDGSWWYKRPDSEALGLQFRITRDYVTGVIAHGDP